MSSKPSSIGKTVFLSGQATSLRAFEVAVVGALNLIKGEKPKFILVGSLTVIIDFIVYFLLINIAGVDISVAKGMSFISGALFAYFGNKTLTFQYANGYFSSSIKFALLYSTTLAVNIIINDCGLFLLQSNKHHVLLSFLTATSASTACNYLGMKHFAFAQQKD